ncbi:hypothetical protein [Streptomyces sp. NPDC058872]|uniref:hypothetical protein n=1 Tax=Streptomyces sp. NPDC058872 TaxID=3346661 RepID=UPI0036A7283E
MSAPYDTVYCDQCGRPITGAVKKVPRFSSSGARPDATVHADRSACIQPAGTAGR